MPDPKKFVLGYRPFSYLEPDPPGWRSTAGLPGEGEPAPDRALEDPGRPRAAFAPQAFFGGAFLPPFRANEVEIARIVLQSTTFDVISVRARVCRRRIYYSVVDEYEGQVGYICKRKSSVRPLTMAQLIDLMETTEVNENFTGLVLGRAQDGFECSGCAGEWVHFAKVTSDIYPQLGAWYLDALKKWYDEKNNKPVTPERLDSR